MKDYIYLKEDNLKKSYLIIFQNLDFYIFFKILFNIFQKNRYLFISIKKPNKFFYNYLCKLGFKIQIFDWSLFKYEERFESHNDSYSKIEKYYYEILKSNKFSNSCIESLYKDNDIVKLAPKKFFINILFDYLNFVFISKKIFKKNKRCIFYTPLNFKLTDNLYKKHFSSKTYNYSFKKNYIYYPLFIELFLNFIIKLIYLTIIILSPLFIIFKLSFKNTTPKKFNIAYRLYNAGLRLHLSENRIDWLVDNTDSFFNKENCLFVGEDLLDKSFLDQVKQNKYNFINLSILKIKFVKKPISFFLFYLRNIIFIIYNSILYDQRAISYYLIAIYYFLKWTSFSQSYHPKNYISYHDYHIQHIFRNSILDKIDCKQSTYKHTYAENIYNINNKTSNIIYSYLVYKNEFHWGRRSILMSKQNSSHSSNFIITKPIDMVDHKNKTYFQNLKKNDIVLSAFASTHGNNCVNNDLSHMIFLESLLSLISNKNFRKKIKYIIFKGKNPYETYIRSKNEKLSKIALLLKKNNSFKIFDSNISAQSIFHKSDLVVSMSFSSTTIEAISIGKRAFFFDSLSQFNQSYYDSIPNLVAHDYNQFLRYIDYWRKIDKFNLKKYYEKYFKLEFGGYGINSSAKDIIKKSINLTGAKI